MNTKWSEKTKFAKILDVISWIALIIWIIFEILERTTSVKYAEFVNYSAILVICVCEAIAFWNVKRALSFVAIFGALLMVAAVVLLNMPVS